MKIIIAVSALALSFLCGCKSSDHSGAFTPPSTKEQNKALEQNLSTVIRIDIKKMSTGDPALIKSIQGEEVNQFIKGMRIDKPAMPCWCMGDNIIECHHEDESITVYYYSSHKLTSSRSGDVYGAPTKEFIILMEEKCQPAH